MKRHRRKAAWRCSALVLAVSLIVPVTSGIAAATEASAFPAKLVGGWSRNVTQANWDKYGLSGPGVVVGVWTMRIKKGGGVDFYAPGGFFPNCKTCLPDFTERFSVAGARLTVSAGAIQLCPRRAVYGWKLSGRALTLKVIADKCNFRKAVFNGIWKRK